MFPAQFCLCTVTSVSCRLLEAKIDVAAKSPGIEGTCRASCGPYDANRIEKSNPGSPIKLFPGKLSESFGYV